MLAFLKTIFGGRTAAPQRTVGLAIPRTVYTPAARPAAAQRPAPAPRTNPKPAPAPPIPAAPLPDSSSDDAPGSDVDIPLQSVLKGLPHDLKDRVRDLDIRGATMSISLERILAQLPSGSVKISFGSLRHAAPQLFSAGADCDSRDVALPLDEILAKINPAIICPPRAQQARGPIDEKSIASDTTVFRHSGLQTPARGASLSVPPISAPGEIARQPENTPPPPPRNVTPKPVAKAPPIRVPTPQTAKPAKVGPCINVDLAPLSESWPAEVRQEIAQWNLPEAKIALPAESVRDAMKLGRVVFSWQVLRSWITPQPAGTQSVHDNAKLELPLALIAPLFLPGQKPSAKSAQKSTVEEIPDLFFDGRKSEGANGANGHEATKASPAILAPESAPVTAKSPNTTAAIEPKTSPAQTASQSSQPASEQGVMRIPLKNLTELWPENVRTEVAHWNLEQLMVALPADAINAALKQGKVIFSWQNLRSWIAPTPPSATSLEDKALLELPLPVIMPLFLASRKQTSKPISKPQPQIADDIPDPFADFLPPPASTSKETPPAPAAVKATPPVAKASDTKLSRKPVPAPSPVEKSTNTRSFTRDQTPALSRSAAEVQPQAETALAVQAQSSTPVEVLATAVNLEGVAGALIALSDGFKVVSKLPSDMDGDALAAFLPHIFSKVNQSTRELRMGELTNLNFTVDNVPWKIFRVNQIFFAALGHAGKPMPTDQLAALANKLTFKN